MDIVRIPSNTVKVVSAMPNGGIVVTLKNGKKTTYSEKWLQNNYLTFPKKEA